MYMQKPTVCLVMVKIVFKKKIVLGLFFKKKIVLSSINILSKFYPNPRHLNSVHILRTHFYLTSFNIIHVFAFRFNHKL